MLCSCGQTLKRITKSHLASKRHQALINKIYRELNNPHPKKAVVKKVGNGELVLQEDEHPKSTAGNEIGGDFGHKLGDNLISDADKGSDENKRNQTRHHVGSNYLRYTHADEKDRDLLDNSDYCRRHCNINKHHLRLHDNPHAHRKGAGIFDPGDDVIKIGSGVFDSEDEIWE